MKKIEQVRGLSVPNPYHCATDASSLDGDIWSTLHPPAWKDKWSGKYIKNPWTVFLVLKKTQQIQPQSIENAKVEVLHLFRCSTHTPRCRGAFKAPTNEMKMKMKENGNEMTMKMRWHLLNRNTRGGTQKGKGKDTPTPTHLARNGQTLKGQGKKEKADGRRAKKPTRAGGRTEAPDTTYKARAKAYLGTRRTQTWPRKGARMK